MKIDASKALEMLQEAKDYWRPIYDKAREDVRFSIGLDHWANEIMDKRGEHNCLVSNQLPQFIHQVMNDIRQQTPSINVLPDGISGDEETAKAIKEIIRGIEYDSDADEAYDVAGESAVRCSVGYFRFDHDYVDDESEEQKLLVRPIANPFSVFLDPSSVEADGSDAEWGFVLDSITRKQFKKLYPKKQAVSFEDKSTRDDKREEIIIGELFYIEEEELSVGKRPIKKRKVHRVKYSGVEELERTTFPGKYIPIIPVYGEVVWVDGERHIMSLIRQAKGAQKRYNYWISMEAEMLSNATQAQWLAAEGQTEDYAKLWANPEETNVLIYKTTDLEGNPVPAPNRIAPPPIPAGFVNASVIASEDIKRTLGMYDAALGQRSNETSGKAIMQRQQESDTANFHFSDNLRRSINHLGRCLVCAIPEIYDTPRVLMAVDNEENAYTVGVNGKMVEGQKAPVDLKNGKYKVRVTTGASFTTKRQEAANFMTQMVQANPQLMQVAGDLVVKSMDIAGAEALASRLKKTLPPGLAEDEEDGQPQDPRVIQLTQMLEQMQMQMQQMGQELQSKQADIQGKQADSMLKSRELEIKEAEAASKAQLEAAKLENERIKLSLEAEKLQLEREKLMIKGSKPEEKQVQPSSIKLDTTGFQFSKTPEQEAMEMEQAQAEQMKEQAELELKQADLQMRMEQTNAVLTALNAITEQLGNLSQQVAQPKKVVRDAEGRVVGVN